jgi:hypothetical protein
MQVRCVDVNYGMFTMLNKCEPWIDDTTYTPRHLPPQPPISLLHRNHAIREDAIAIIAKYHTVAIKLYENLRKLVHRSNRCTTRQGNPFPFPRFINLQLFASTSTPGEECIYRQELRGNKKKTSPQAFPAGSRHRRKPSWASRIVIAVARSR